MVILKTLYPSVLIELLQYGEPFKFVQMNEWIVFNWIIHVE